MMLRLLIITCAYAALPTERAIPTPDIRDLTDNITEELSNTPVAVVNFHAPWCSHCMRFEGEYALAASKVSGVLFARLDCALYRETSEEHHVEGYPHIKLYRHGRFASDYEGPNEAHALARWVSRRANPSVDELHDWHDARPFLASLFGNEKSDDGAVGLVVGVFASNSSKVARTFASVDSGDDGDDVSFALTTKPELVAQALKERDHTIQMDLSDNRVHVLSVNGEDVKTLRVDESTSGRAIAAFVAAALEPAVTRFDSQTAASLFHGSRGPRVHALLFVDESSKRAPAVADAFATVAAAERYRARHVVVPATEARVLKHFDLDTGFDLPTVVIADLRGLAPSVGADELVLDDAKDVGVRPKKARAFRMRDWNASSSVEHDLHRFYAEFYADNLSHPFLRSETLVGSLAEAPQRAKQASEQGEVVTLTGKTFELVVEDKRRDKSDERDFLVLFHAPWCGHCLALMPVWAQLAQLYRRVHSIVVASVDATKNEVAALDVDAFPAVYLFSASGQEPVAYDGALDLDALSRFLKARGTRAFDVDGLKGGGELRDEL